MIDEYTEMFSELTKLITNNNTITGNCILEILKKYSSTISVFWYDEIHIT